jgi:hypothetical protein
MRAWPVFIFISLSIIPLYFQNCARPHSLSDAFTFASLSETSEVEVTEGDSITLRIPSHKVNWPLDATPISELVSWSYTDIYGRRNYLEFSDLELRIENVQPEDRGTYTANVIQADGSLANFRYRLSVRVVYGQNPDYRATFTREFVNNPCERATDAPTYPTDTLDLTYREALLACQSATTASNRNNRAILCSFDGRGFYVHPNTYPRDVFRGEQRNNSGSLTYRVRDVDRCTARTECRDFIDTQTRSGNAGSANEIQCFWGESDSNPINPFPN